MYPCYAPHCRFITLLDSCRFKASLGNRSKAFLECLWFIRICGNCALLSWFAQLVQDPGYRSKLLQSDYHGGADLPWAFKRRPAHLPEIQRLVPQVSYSGEGFAPPYNWYHPKHIWEKACNHCCCLCQAVREVDDTGMRSTCRNYVLETLPPSWRSSLLTVNACQAQRMIAWPILSGSAWRLKPWCFSRACLDYTHSHCSFVIANMSDFASGKSACGRRLDPFSSHYLTMKRKHSHITDLCLMLSLCCLAAIVKRVFLLEDCYQLCIEIFASTLSWNSRCFSLDTTWPAYVRLKL